VLWRSGLALIATSVAVGAALGTASSPAQAASSTAFGNSTPASLRTITKGAPAELGLRFVPSTDGTVTKVRFYKPAKNASTTPASVSLWSADGARLAKAPVNRTSRTGWISVTLKTPVKLSAKKGYVVSTFAKTGAHPATRNYFAHARETSLITMPKNAGVYSKGWTSRFPTHTFRASNYWIDTEFTPKTKPTAPAKTPTARPTATKTATAAKPTATTSATATRPPASTVRPTSPATTVRPPATTTPSAPATSSPSTSLMGWQLNANNVGLAPFGLKCSSLPRYTGSLTPAAGTHISGVRIVGHLDLRNGGIVVERSCIQPVVGAQGSSGTESIVSNFVCGRDSCPVISDRTIIIRDSEIDATAAPASQIASACAFRGVGTLQRNYMHGMGSGICFYGTGTRHDAIAEQNYVTDLRSYGSSHNEAATIRDLSRQQNPNRVARFTGNRLSIGGSNVTAGLFIQPTSENIDTIRVDGNLIEGAGYNLFLNQPGSGGKYSDARATNNRFVSTGWGPSAVQGGSGWVQWSNNYRYNAAASGARGTAVSAG
jgi:hypothetical protein